MALASSPTALAKSKGDWWTGPQVLAHIERCVHPEAALIALGYEIEPFRALNAFSYSSSASATVKGPAGFAPPRACSSNQA